MLFRHGRAAVSLCLLCTRHFLHTAYGQWNGSWCVYHPFFVDFRWPLDFLCQSHAADTPSCSRPKPCVDAVARQRVSLYGQSAIGWDVVGQAQWTPCRADADTPAGPSLTDKSVLRYCTDRETDGMINAAHSIFTQAACAMHHRPSKAGSRRRAKACWDRLTTRFRGSLMSNLLRGVTGVLGGTLTVGYHRFFL